MAWIARLSHVFHELRLIYSAQDASSAGARRFLEKHYSLIKELNPGLPFYVRPFDAVREPYLTARLHDGNYVTRELTGLEADSVLGQLRELTETAQPLDSTARRRQLADII
ncbi:hypothetical protein CCYA_CCYA11G3072 [Cyanidiococcus yangmingshanensis]|uniref:Ndufa2, NADH:ubiquinone oxidoreductase 10.5kD subunit n=1 Tax=Cyanidiococcus yangmingshanensis TaxID=2690220 RepID=A0A7J7IGN3_9RHOD|nr:ndufa2, NADH:ubiquinone oxidoreductase 10.5kD subunit [Cyanidiococcus yangmingshanensis]KAK4532215.1 hypothetical protein CCYA_CCYA11G3072 [Cyanidiococcus yangmingshanensis]